LFSSQYVNSPYKVTQSSPNYDSQMECDITIDSGTNFTVGTSTAGMQYGTSDTRPQDIVSWECKAAAGDILDIGYHEIQPRWKCPVGITPDPGGSRTISLSTGQYEIEAWR